MKAMILAAGRGERMRELTLDTPKPLLPLLGVPMIERLISKLRDAGITDLIINTAWQGKKLRDHLGNGAALGVSIQWSDEGDWPLGTAEGIRRALPLLGTQPFLLINGDLVGNFDLVHMTRLQPQNAHLLLAKNPGHNPKGDFGLEQGKLLLRSNVSEQSTTLTYLGCGIFNPQIFHHSSERELGPLLNRLLAEQQPVEGELFSGWWLDVGTPERLRLAEELLRDSPADQ